MMNSLIQRFPSQLKEAIEIGEQIQLDDSLKPIRAIYVAGIGGSGIGGNFVAELVRDELKIPYIVGKSYDIPAFINDQCLAICSSYSGNTEETLMAYEKLKSKGAKIIIISSGGKLIELAKKEGHDYIKLPADWPAPRACLGYSLVQQLYVLKKLHLISERKIEQIHRAYLLLIKEQNNLVELAKNIAETLNGKIPIVYSIDRMEPVSLRWRQQFNENSKILSWHNVIPELNHNELVGWRDASDELAVIFLRNHDDFSKNQVRANLTREIVNEFTSTIVDIYSKGESLIEQMMYLVHLGDYVSYELAQLRGVDSLEVRAIDFLKRELKKAAGS